MNRSHIANWSHLFQTHQNNKSIFLVTIDTESVKKSLFFIDINLDLYNSLVIILCISVKREIDKYLLVCKKEIERK